MSAQGATALYERVSSDEEFRARLEAAATPQDKRQIVTEAGYDVSRDDLPTFLNLAGVSELSDEELEAVAAGIMEGGYPPPPVNPTVQAVLPVFGA